MENKVNQKIIFVLLIIIIFIVLFYGNNLFFKKDKIIANINNINIYEKDIVNAQKTEECYGGEKYSEEVTLIKLINVSLEKLVLNYFEDDFPSKEDILQKSDWVDENTKAPEILNCVKDVYSSSKDDYLFWYISPIIENNSLYQSFFASKEINKEEFDKIQLIKNRIERGEKISEIEDYSIISINKKENVSDVLKEYDQYDKANFLIEDILSNLSPEETWPEIIEQEYSYNIYELKEETESSFIVGVISVLKKDFDVWFKDYVKSNVKIKIFEESLSQKIINDHKDVWWSQYINN